jgi:hypothetical protein
MGWRRWGGVACIAALAGCPTDPTGASDAESSGDASESGNETTAMPPAVTLDGSGSTSEPNAESDADICPETHACVAPVPTGWHGPVAIRDGEAATCPEVYPTIEVDGFAEVLGAPPRCTCECDASSLCGALIGGDIESACEFPSPIIGNTEFALPDACEPIPPLDGGGFHLGFEPDPLAVCEPAATSTMADPTMSGRVLVCGDPVLVAGCEDDFVCAPRIDDASELCIVQTGAHECPLEYPTVRVAWTGMLDERACSPSECTAPDAPATCNAAVRISSTDDCESPAVPDFDVGAFTCVPNDGAALSFLRYSDVTALVSGCTPSGGAAIGGVSPADPVTICCI